MLLPLLKHLSNGLCTRGFITASKAKNVYTRQISVERQPKTDVSVLVNSLTEQKDVLGRQHIA